jgi:AcrR family transcriptional regulator
MGTRQKRGERKQQLLLEAAKDLVTQGGIEGLTIARLAAQVGASVGGVYRHFVSKEAIVVALQAWTMDSFREELALDLGAAQSFVRARKDDAHYLFLSLVAQTAYLRHAENDPARHRLLELFVGGYEQPASDELAAQVTAAFEPILARCAATLDDAAQAGALAKGDTIERVQVSWALVHGLDCVGRRGFGGVGLGTRFGLPELRDASFRSLLIGWGAKPDSVDRALGRLRQFDAARVMPVEFTTDAQP